MTQVQDAMSRITLDVIMATGFDLRWDAADLDRPCALLDDMHFLMAETFMRAAHALRALHPQHASSHVVSPSHRPSQEHDPCTSSSPSQGATATGLVSIACQ